jgi:hypothetical protein
LVDKVPVHQHHQGKAVVQENLVVSEKPIDVPGVESPAAPPENVEEQPEAVL